MTDFLFTATDGLWPDRFDSAVNRELLAQSGLFDAASYLAQAGPEGAANPVAHYLLKGWRIGREPSTAFPGAKLQPYFASAGFNQPAAITWLVQRAAGWPIPESWNDVQTLATRVRATGLFDEAFYGAQLPGDLAGLDPAIHYAIVGERMGLSPSAQFDATFYLDFYPDVARAGVLGLLHYAENGRNEGRLPLAPPVCRTGLAVWDPAKDNVLLVVHEASRTGAPVLGWNIACHLAKRYNLHTVCLGEGELTSDFKAVSVQLHGPFPPGYRYNSTFVGHSISELLDSRPFRYAIVNSAESRYVLEACARRLIPSVLLMHEFASYVLPLSSLTRAFDLSTDIIFPAPVVARAAKDKYPLLAGRTTTHVLSQGHSLLPAREVFEKTVALPDPDLAELTHKHQVEGTFIVMGAGGVQIRKGVDLFLYAAAIIARVQPESPIHFMWVGHGYRPEDDGHYSVYLYEQLHRSGLSGRVTFLDAVPDLEPVYRIADAFFLASRLDPFPNVAMDAIERGIPMVCFNDASGTADLLLSDAETSSGVVEYMDVEAAARAILKLAENQAIHQRVSQATRRLALNSFLDMETYVDRLDAIGTDGARRMQQRAADAKTLLADPAFDQTMYLGLRPIVETRADSIIRYLTMASVHGHSFMDIRRPAPGFQRPLYVAEHKASLAGGIDPLADFIRRGKPAGAWSLPVLRADDPDQGIQPAGHLRVALHAHFYYPELAADFLAHLKPNRCRCDLLVTTDNSTKAEQLHQLLAPYGGGSIEIRITPNRGRDIGPLLSGFSNHLANYDVIGHVHSKRSLVLDDPTSGETWRQFLWQNLLGGKCRMMDRIIAAFEQDDHLGLVFPSDPHPMDWSDNRVPAANLAARMGWTGPLPDHFDFPLGTMFWMRRAALQPLLDLHLDWDDYPAEPLPYDGTILHAIERLMPMVCQLAGFTSAVTHVFGVTW